MNHAVTRGEILGLPVDVLTMDETVDRCLEAIREDQPLTIGVLNAAKVVNAQGDVTLRDALDGCDLVVADGQAVVWAGRLLGRPLPERVAGVDLFFRLLEAAASHGHSVYLLGATDEVLQTAVSRIRQQHPFLTIAGARDGYFPPEEEPAVAEAIRRSGAAILFVAMSSPKKERFLDDWSTELGALVRHGVGGSFDVLAGKTKRAPAGWQRAGLEWLYRLLQEPGRMWRRYLVTNTAFIVLVMRELVRRRRGMPA